MSAVVVIITLWTVWPLMSMPRMSLARACASSARVGELDAARLAPAADLHLRLDHHPAAEALGDRAGLLRGLGDATGQHRQPMPGEQFAPLVLVQVHVTPLARRHCGARQDMTTVRRASAAA